MAINDGVSYVATADALTNRIVALGLQVLAIDSPWALFKVDGFRCDDLAPSFAQAQFALVKAQAILRQQLAEREATHGRD
jgi:hypothetical protein